MLGVVGWVSGERASAQQSSAVQQQGGVTSFTVPSSASNLSLIDFENAKAMPMPSLAGQPESGSLLKALMGASSGPSQGQVVGAGADGDGEESPVRLARTQPEGSSDIVPQEFGSSGHVFSTARGDLGTLKTNKAYPYRAAGKLFFNIGASTYLCSASLIKPGVVVTAAHCVANYGASQFYSNWQFVPGYRNGVAPYGVWTATTAVILTAYYNGTDGCAVYGVVCPDDVAVIILNPDAYGHFAGKKTGYLGYGWNGWGFNGTITQITQVGYPVCLDNGLLEQRNDSYGYTSSSYSNNTVIGSLMCGGSSGGPWVVNFGTRPALTGTSSGNYPTPNIVVGVTSWGYTDLSVKEQGASPFTSGNIVALVNYACSTYPTRC
jgi:hypothetical protein